MESPLSPDEDTLDETFNEEAYEEEHVDETNIEARPNEKDSEVDIYRSKPENAEELKPSFDHTKADEDGKDRI